MVGTAAWQNFSAHALNMFTWFARGLDVLGRGGGAILEEPLEEPLERLLSEGNGPWSPS